LPFLRSACKNFAPTTTHIREAQLPQNSTPKDKDEDETPFERRKADSGRRAQRGQFAPGVCGCRGELFQRRPRGRRIRKSFEDVTKAVKSLVAKNGMMVMAEVDQGKMLSMTGLHLQAKLFLIGNPNVGKQLFEQDHAVGLYVPLRLFVYTDANGKTHVAYDKPSTLLGQFQNEKVGMVAGMLDQKIEGLAAMAAQ
jgi:uncharacterized protein (DUF302 family)